MLAAGDFVAYSQLFAIYFTGGLAGSSLVGRKHFDSAASFVKRSVKMFRLEQTNSHILTLKQSCKKCMTHKLK